MPIQQEDLVALLMGERGKTARKILQEHNSGFSVYSCNPSIIERIINDKDKKEVIDLVNQANNEEKDVEVILFEREFKTKDPLEDFFNSFDSEKTKRRLFILMGETGVGKTYVIEKRYPSIPVIACNSSVDPYSLCYYLADKDGTGLKPHPTPFLKAVKGELKDNRILFDEGNSLPHDTLMLVQGLTDEKKSIVIGDELVHISPKFRIMMTMNPPSETDERNPIGDALLGRAVGLILRLTDQILIQRIGVNQEWLNAIRQMFSELRAAKFVDIRPLDFRDYQKFIEFNTESQIEFKICQGDVSNISAYKRLLDKGEFQQRLKEILILTQQIKSSKGE
jgi:hypothetical protein